MTPPKKGTRKSAQPSPPSLEEVPVLAGAPKRAKKAAAKAPKSAEAPVEVGPPSLATPPPGNLQASANGRAPVEVGPPSLATPGNLLAAPKAKRTARRKRAPETVMILALSGVLVAIDAVSGTRLWEHRTPYPTQHVLVTDRHVLVVYDKAADRLDRSNGVILSRFPLPFTPQTVVADGEDVLFAVASNVLRVGPDGKVRWRIAAEPEPRRALGQISWMVMRDEEGFERWRTEGDAFYAGNPAQIVTIAPEAASRYAAALPPGTAGGGEETASRYAAAPKAAVGLASRKTPRVVHEIPRIRK